MKFLTIFGPWKNPPPVELFFYLMAVVSIPIVGLLLYGYTLEFPFVFDDHIYLVDNPLVKDASSFIYQGDFTTFASLSRKLDLDPDLSTNFILRPVAYLTFYLNYRLGGMHPAGFRVVNIAIHLINALLLFHLIARVLSASAKRGALTPFSTGFIALATALLFLVHPLQIESVTYIVQRFTSLGTLFYLGTILTFLAANKAEELSSATRWRGVSLSCFIIGLFVKEFLFTLPFALVLLDTLLMGTPLKTTYRRVLPYFFCLPIIPVLILFTSQAQNEGAASLANAFNITNGSGYSQYHYALTQLSVVLTYVRLLLWPTGQNLDWDYPLITSFWSDQAFFSALTIAGLLGGAWLCYRRFRHDVRAALFCFSVLWFFLTLAIDSSIVPLPDLLAEHRTYLPSIGILCALACGADVLRTHVRIHRVTRYLVPALLVLWILGLALATQVRHQVWRSEIANWTDVTDKSPKKFRAWSNLGVIYCEKGRAHDALTCFRKATTLQPTAFVVYRNMGYAQLMLAQYREAIQTLRLGVQLSPDDYRQYNMMGLSYIGLNDIQNSERAFKKAVTINPAFRPSHISLATLYANRRLYDKALEHFRLADSLQPLNKQERQVADQMARLRMPQQGQTPR